MGVCTDCLVTFTVRAFYCSKCHILAVGRDKQFCESQASVSHRPRSCQRFAGTKVSGDTRPDIKTALKIIGPSALLPPQVNCRSHCSSRAWAAQLTCLTAKRVVGLIPDAADLCFQNWGQASIFALLCHCWPWHSEMCQERSKARCMF